MNILFLTDNYPPETNAPASRTSEHARVWVEKGHSVTVITCFPNFPGGKIFPGYKNKFREVYQLDGVKVVRVKTYITANEGFIKRTLDYISFMVSGTIAACFEPKPDIIVATSPQFFCAMAGYLTAKLKRRPWVFELRDIWPASISAVGAMSHGRIYRFLERIELFLYRKSTGIITVTKSFREELIERGIDSEKIEVVTNGVELTKYQPMDKDPVLTARLNLGEVFVVGYIGTHGMAHALPKVIEAAEIIGKKDLPICFIFVGSGAEKEKIERIVEKRSLTNVQILGQQPKESMPSYWSVCDLAIIPLKNHAVFSGVLPSKLFECMGMRIPVLMSLPEGEATDIVKSTGCGVVVEPENAQAMASEIISLYSDSSKLSKLKLNAGIAAPSFSREQQAIMMMNILSSLADC